MGRVSFSQFFVLIARLVLTGVFIRAALPKIKDPMAFEVSVNAFRVIGAELSSWVALGLPWMELVLGVGILFPWIKRTSSWLIAVLLLVFIGLHASAWMRGLEISCGCFGADAVGESTNYLWLITRNTALFVLCCFVIQYDWKSKHILASNGTG